MVYDFDWDGDSLTIGDDEGLSLVLDADPTHNQAGVDQPGLLAAVSDYVNFGVFNGNFRFGPPLPFLDASNSTSGSNFMPGWRFVRSSNSNITVQHVRDASSPSGSNLRFTFASGLSNDAAIVEQIIDIGGSRDRVLADAVRATGVTVTGTGVALRGRYQYISTDGSLVGMPAEIVSSAFGAGATPTGTESITSATTVPPGNARFLRVRIEAYRTAGTGAASVDLMDVRRTRGQSYLLLADQDPAFRPGYIIQEGGIPYVEQLNTSVAMPLGYQLVPLTFVFVDMPAGATTNLIPSDNALNLGEQPRIKAPWAGSIVGMSYRMTDAPTAGTMTLRATVNGSNVWSPFGAVGSGGAAGDHATQPLATDAFVAGDYLGVDCVTTAGYLPVTRDYHVTLWVAITYDGL